MWKMFVRILLALAFSLQMNTARAEIYKWTDERGNVHYSDEKSDQHPVETVTPNTEKLGVELSTPQDAQQWQKDVTSGAAATDDRPHDHSATAIPAATPGSTTQTSSTLDTNAQDYCDGMVGDCFAPQQDRVCLLRYGVRCKAIYHWKVCLHEQCKSDRLADKCESPFYFLQQRPAVLGLRDLGRPLPLQEAVSALDWQCLSTHGLFCDEVANEADCQQRYNQSCSQLKNWLTDARERCRNQRDGDCDALELLVKYRPATQEEMKKAGVLLPQGGLQIRDLLFESMDILKNDVAANERLQPVLERMTGLNVTAARKWVDCTPQRPNIIDRY